MPSWGPTLCCALSNRAVVVYKMCDSGFLTDPLILVPSQKLLWLISKRKIQNLHFGENFIKIGQELGKLFRV